MFTAPRANEYYIEHYDHNIIRPNQDQFLVDDKFANPQLNEKVFIQVPLFSHSVQKIKNMITSFQKHFLILKLTNLSTKKIETFSLSFHFFTPKERDLLCSHDIMLRTKQTHTYTYYKIKLAQLNHDELFKIMASSFNFH